MFFKVFKFWYSESIMYGLFICQHVFFLSLLMCTVCYLLFAIRLVPEMIYYACVEWDVRITLPIQSLLSATRTCNKIKLSGGRFLSRVWFAQSCKRINAVFMKAAWCLLQRLQLCDSFFHFVNCANRLFMSGITMFVTFPNSAIMVKSRKVKFI